MDTIKAAQSALSTHFGYDSFRDGQAELISHTLSRRDCLGVMPTGAGKSLCYQIPALLFEGMSLVISPLISLMKDQVEALRANGVASAYLNSSLSAREQADVFAAITRGEVKLLYIAPERLESPAFLDLLKNENGSGANNTGNPINISLVAVDEAHCISQWGQDFRRSYLQIPSFIESLGVRPVVVAYTATATKQVQVDIVKQLRLQDPYILITSFDRPNLFFEVKRQRRAAEKMQQLLNFLKQHDNESGIIYCSTRAQTEELCEKLCALGIEATRYHAGLIEQERHHNQEDFLFDRSRIMVATNAFGMGIDKSNVRFVVHYNSPLNMEAYYQEAGRAGRDGAQAWCLLLHCAADVESNRNLLMYSERKSREAELDDDAELDSQNLITAEELLAKDLSLLKQVTYYATSDGCLRQAILNYFDEETEDTCGTCSGCIGEFIDVDITVEAQKILSCVYRLNEIGRQLGKSKLTKILRGSRSKWIKDERLDRISTYGIMNEVSEPRVNYLIDLLSLRGYLRSSGTAYPVLRLGKRAAEVLTKSPQKIMLKEVVGSNFDSQESKAEQKVASSKQRSSKSSKAATKRELNEAEFALFEKLRSLRRELAEQEAVPAFVIFSDATLYDMLDKLPQNPEEFLEVSGVGEVKQQRYGEAFLAVLQGADSDSGDDNGSKQTDSSPD